jgi:predicted RNA-binding Zn-ribbon protein involved in translation (DUF1610 family)
VKKLAPIKIAPGEMSMSYYEVSGSVSAKALRTVSYECENCGKAFSYQFELVMGSTQTESTAAGTNKDKLKKIVFRLKDKARPIALEKIQNEIKSLDASSDYGHEACPNCGYLQSWMIKAWSKVDSDKVGKKVELPTIILTGIFLVLAIVLPIQVPSVSYLVSCLLSFVLWSIGVLIIMRYALSFTNKPNEDFGKVDKENTPAVTWSEPESIM